MKPFAIAGVQMPVSARANNVPAIVDRLDLCLAKFPWVEMVLFSELAAHGPLIAHAEPLGGPTETAFQQAAARHGIWLVPGSFFERTADGRIFNTAPVIAPDGSIVTRCRKLFPFLPYEQGVEYGTEFCIFDVPDVGRFGVSICYDIWFPETTRMLTALGAEILLHPVLTGTIDREVEIAMARATAVQFQCYVFDINGLGDGGVGHSCVFGPSGTVLYAAGAGEQMIPIEVDLDRVRRQRERGVHGLGQPLKSFRDRRIEFPIYDKNYGGLNYLQSLGPLEMPTRRATGLAPDPTSGKSGGEI